MQKTTPVINYERYRQNCKQLRDAIDDPEETNIAISGIFGSGKSSLIKNYERIYNNKEAEDIINSFESKKDHSDDDYNQFNQKIKELSYKQKNKTLTLSLANFNIVGDKECDNNENNKNFQNVSDNETSFSNTALDKRQSIKKDYEELKRYREKRQNNIDCSAEVERNIERSLLQQMVYSVKSTDLVDSNISRIMPRHKYKVLAFVSFIFSLISIVVFCLNRFSLLWRFSEFINKSIIIIGVLSLISLASTIPVIFKITSFKVDTIEIAMNDNELKNNESLLSKYADEIIYFFQKSGFKVVYFEDLDRLPNLNIFNKLREINYLINNSPNIPYKVTFVYCVSDNIISDYEERSKFFHNIISVIPYVNSENMKTRLETLIDNKDNLDKIRVSEFAQDMSQFVIDSRLSVFIENDYNNFLSKYNKGDKITTNEKIKILTLSIYKNIYYYDYNKVSKNDSCLDKSFEILRYLRKDAEADLLNSIKDLSNKLEKKQEIPYAKLNTIKEIFAGFIALYGTSASSYSLYDCVDIVNLDFETLKTENKYKHNGKYLKLADLQEHCYKSFNKSIEDFASAAELEYEDDCNQLRNKIEKVRNEIANIHTCKISEFMNNYDCSEIDNHFINLCLKKGYIENDYRKYIYGESESYLEESDDAFVRYNNFGETNSPIENNYLYPLKEYGKIIQNIYEDKFKLYKILNLGLVNYIYKDKAKLPNDISNNIKYLLSSKNDKVREFYVEYLKNSSVEDCILITKIFYDSDEFIKAFRCVLGSIETEKQQRILNCLMNDCIFDKLHNDNKLEMRELLNNNTDWKGIKVGQTTIDNLSSLGKLDLSFIQTFDKSSLKFVVNNNLFGINLGNIEYLATKYFSEKDKSKILNIFIKSDNKNFVDYIVLNIEKIIAIVEPQVIDENLVYIVLECEKIGNTIKLLFIEKVSFIIETVKKIDISIMKRLVELKKYAYNVKTIFELSFILTDEEFSNYFSTPEFKKMNFDQLEEVIADSRYNDFQKEVINTKMLSYDNNIDIANSFKIKSLSFNALLDKKSDNYALRLIENNLIEMTQDNLKYLKNCPESYCALARKDGDKCLEMMKNDSSILNDKVATVLFCKTQDIRIKSYIANELYDLIDLTFTDGIYNYFGEIISALKMVKLENDLLLNRIMRFIKEDGKNYDVLELLINNHSYYTNNEFYANLCKIDNRYLNCEEGFEISKKDNKIFIEGFNKLSERGLIKLDKSTKDKLKITNISL